MPEILHLDFETRSTVDLPKAGLHKYADPMHTQVLCVAWAFGDEEIEYWRLGMEAGATNLGRAIDHIVSGGDVWAHNASFEFHIWNKCFNPLDLLKLEQMTCTMAMAYAMGLPGSLEKCAAALGVSQQKDMEGSRLMLQMSKPREILPDGKIIWWEDEERLDRLLKYCIQDVNVEREIGKRMLKLTPYEKKVWILDQKINNRGITVDRKAVENAVKLVELQKDVLDAKIRAASGNQIATCSSIQQIKDYLEFYGVGEESLSKSDVTGLLDSKDLDPHAREILEIRSQGGKAATAKLGPMLTGIGPDNRLRGCFQYSGANTRRWAGRRVQLHNLKRPSIPHQDIESIVTFIANGGSAEEIDVFFGAPLSILADCTRAFLTAAPGKNLFVADFSAIEARVLAWLAGQDDVLEIFRNNEDIYLVQASKIAGHKITDKEDPWRQIGKVAILALGYAGGVGAFQTMAKGYGVKMEPAFNELWRTAGPEIRDRAEQRFTQAGKDFEISREEFLASEITKIKWREANAMIVSYWAAAEQAFMNAVLHPGQIFAIGQNNRVVKFKKSGSFVFCQLPGGGVISYPYPEIKDSKTPWGDIKQLPSYMAEDGQSKKWMRFSTYGGSIVENITQAVARDLLADAMLRLDSKAYEIIAHVHDEIICEMPHNIGKVSEMKEIMCDNPKWAFDLPIAASGFKTFRYRK